MISNKSNALDIPKASAKLAILKFSNLSAIAVSYSSCSLLEVLLYLVPRTGADTYSESVPHRTHARELATNQ